MVRCGKLFNLINVMDPERYIALVDYDLKTGKVIARMDFSDMNWEGLEEHRMDERNVIKVSELKMLKFFKDVNISHREVDHFATWSTAGSPIKNMGVHEVTSIYIIPPTAHTQKSLKLAEERAKKPDKKPKRRSFGTRSITYPPKKRKDEANDS